MGSVVSVVMLRAYCQSSGERAGTGAVGGCPERYWAAH